MSYNSEKQLRMAFTHRVLWHGRGPRAQYFLKAKRSLWHLVVRWRIECALRANERQIRRRGHIHIQEALRGVCDEEKDLCMRRLSVVYETKWNDVKRCCWKWKPGINRKQDWRFCLIPEPSLVRLLVSHAFQPCSQISPPKRNWNYHGMECAAFADWSASTFPGIPLWPGTQ